MNGNMLAIVLAVAGIVVGFVTSWWFTRSSKRDADDKQQKLLDKISALEKEASTQQEMTSTLKGLFTDVADRFAEPAIPHSGRALRPAQFSGHVGQVLEASPQPSASAPALDVVVRASLGALLDEHGEVSVPRLLRAVAQRLPDATPSLISSSLEELRNAGKLSWRGDDVMKAGVIKIYPQ